MDYKKQLNNSNGDRVNIRIETYASYGTLKYTVDFIVIPKGKRKETNPLSELRDTWAYRNLKFGSQERQDMLKQELLKWISEDQLNDCLNEFWNSISPFAVGYEIRQQ